MIWYDMIWYDMIWYDMIWYAKHYMIWYDMQNTIWYDLICNEMKWLARNKVKYSMYCVRLQHLRFLVIWKLDSIYLAVFMYQLISVLNVIKLQILSSESSSVKELSAESFNGGSMDTRRGDWQVHRQTNMTDKQTNRQTDKRTGWQMDR